MKDKNCGLCKPTRKQHYEYVAREIERSQDAIRTANTEQGVNEALEYLSRFIISMSKDSEMMDLNEYIKGIQGTIYSVELRDATRLDLEATIDGLLERVRQIIDEESKKERARRLKNLFQELADNAEEIADIIDLSVIGV